MKKNLQPKVNSEILKQLATEKLVDMLVEQARAIGEHPGFALLSIKPILIR